MKRALILILAATPCAFAQDAAPQPAPQVVGGGPVISVQVRDFDAPVTGAPYSANTSVESVQTLADGNRIVHNSTGMIARDSQGRIRRDLPAPEALGGLSVANVPHLVVINDPVAHVSYTLNLTDKTAFKNPMPTAGPNGQVMTGGPVVAGGGDAFFVQAVNPPPAGGAVQQTIIASAGPPPNLKGSSPEEGQVTTENLGSQTIEGVTANGTRTTQTIPAGAIGNEQPITIASEIWTSPDLRTVVMSKRSDPRMGDQTFQLTNIVRGDPDPSLFTLPADFKIVDGPQNFIYRTKQ